MKIPSCSINFGFMLFIASVCHIWREEKRTVKQKFTILNKIIVIIPFFFFHSCNSHDFFPLDLFEISYPSHSLLFKKAFPAYLSFPFFSLSLHNVQCHVPETPACLLHQNL